MIEAYKNYWKGYIDFKGKTSVGGYWWAFLANIIVSFVFSFVITLLGSRGATLYANSILISFTLICVPASLAIMVRRLRDAGNHWANVFWAFLPIVGTIILIIKLCQPTQAENTAAPVIYNRPAAQSNIPAYTPPAPGYQPISNPFSQNSFGSGFKKLAISSLPPYFGSGVCDVCLKPVSSANARIVPNSTFYSSPEWREHFKNMNTVKLSLSGVNADQYIEHMRLNDKSLGSAVCDNCIHMFAE